MKNGQLITLEGIEGAGKSTHVPTIKTALEQAGKKVLVTREPGGTEVAEAIRAVLLSAKLPNMHMQTELLLMFAARAEHLQRKILPALYKGVWVICDRFTDASYAYQGGGRGVDRQRIALLEQWVQADFRPDLTLLFDLPAEVGLARASKRGVMDRFEQEQLSFFAKVRACYLKRAQQESQRFRLIDANLTLSAVEQAVKEVIQQHCNALY